MDYGTSNSGNRDRLCGIEIELENVTNYDVLYWTQVTDGSLKMTGAEFTLPVFESSVVPALTTLFQQQKDAITSKRCSVHVHVDVHDFTLQDIIKLILLYLVYEKFLYEISGKRWNSNFCVPLSTINFEYLLNNTFGMIAKRCTKYTGFHFVPGKRYSTVEFRHMKGTKDINLITVWTEILANLVNFSKDISLEEVIHLVDTMHTTSEYNNLTERIFRQNAYLFTTQQNYKEVIEEQIRLTKLRMRS